ALLRDAEVRNHLKIGGVKLLNAAGQPGDWQVARKHARSGPKSSTVSRIHGRICATVQRMPKMHSIPKILIATLSRALAVARARFQVSWPSLVRSIGQPITGSTN